MKIKYVDRLNQIVVYLIKYLKCSSIKSINSAPTPASSSVNAQTPQGEELQAG